MTHSRRSRHDSAPAMRVQYSGPWGTSAAAPRVLPEDIAAAAPEVAEFYTFCLGTQLSPAHITEAQCWQFAALKNEFFLNESIPYTEKMDRARTLLAWHPIVCKYYSLGPEQGADWLKTQAQRCMALEAFEIEFLQLLALGESPKPVPEAILKEIQAGLQQHVQQQQAILAQLRQQRLPIWVQAGKELKLIWPEEICFISSEAKAGLEVFTTTGERWPCFQTVSALEQQLSTEPDFMRTSRQHLVNLSHIDCVIAAGRGRDLTFRGLAADFKARVTDGYLKAFLERLHG